AERLELRQVKVAPGDRPLRNAEERRVELVEEIVGDSPAATRRRELQEAAIVGAVVDAHGVDDDILPREPERPALVVVVGSDGQLILEPEDDCRRVAYPKGQARQEPEPDTWGEPRLIEATFQPVEAEGDGRLVRLHRDLALVQHPLVARSHRQLLNVL